MVLRFDGGASKAVLDIVTEYETLTNTIEPHSPSIDLIDLFLFP